MLHCTAMHTHTRQKNICYSYCAYVMKLPNNYWRLGGWLRRAAWASGAMLRARGCGDEHTRCNAGGLCELCGIPEDVLTTA